MTLEEEAQRGLGSGYYWMIKGALCGTSEPDCHAFSGGQRTWKKPYPTVRWIDETIDPLEASSSVRFLEAGTHITYIVHHICAHTELMDMLLVVVKVLACLLASQTHEKKMSWVCVYVTAQGCACVLSAALANAIIIIVMSQSWKVIVRYNIQREKESSQLLEDILQWTGVSVHICMRETGRYCEKRANSMWGFFLHHCLFLRSSQKRCAL